MMKNTNYYESVQVSEKISLEELLLCPACWGNMLVVAFFAPSTLFKSVKYGGGIGLPSALFVLLNTYYCAALLHSSGYILSKSIIGGVYLALIGLALWYACSALLFKVRKKMAVHPRFKHFIRFAVWNQLLCLVPFTAIYAATFFWPIAEIFLALIVCVSFGYSIYGFINVFQPRSILAPMATVICGLSLFATLSLVIGVRGADGQHSVATAWMDPKIAVPRLEYHYQNEKRTMIAMYNKWINPNYKEPKKLKVASN
jgi:hypothetical protein